MVCDEDAYRLLFVRLIEASSQRGANLPPDATPDFAQMATEADFRRPVSTKSGRGGRRRRGKQGAQICANPWPGVAAISERVNNAQPSRDDAGIAQLVEQLICNHSSGTAKGLRRQRVRVSSRFKRR